MIIETDGKPRWSARTVDSDRVVCGLCGKRLQIKSRALIAIWTVRGGWYAQALHAGCARLIKYWGRLREFDDPMSAEKWLKTWGCKDCDNRLHCGAYAFGCRRAVTRAVQAGIWFGGEQDEPAPEGFEPRFMYNGAYLPDSE